MVDPALTPTRLAARFDALEVEPRGYPVDSTNADDAVALDQRPQDRLQLMDAMQTHSATVSFP